MQRSLPDPLPPLLGLEAFEAAARSENFAAAAAELSVSQATVSHRIRALERHLGHPLFERLPRGVRLTERGRAYLPSVRDAFEQVVGSTAAVFGHATHAHLTLRAPVAYNTLWLPPLIERFRHVHPTIEITTTSSVFTAMMSTDGVDVEIWQGSGRWPGFENHRLFLDSSIVVGSASTASDLGVRPSISSIAERSLVHLMGSDDHWSRLFRTAEISRPPQAADLRVDTTVAAIGHLLSSDRLALLPQRLVQPMLDRGVLVRMSDTHVAAAEAIHLTLPQSEGRASTESIVFRDWLLSELDTI